MNKSVNPIASLIIPVFNEKDYIERCIESVISSTEGIENMELLLIDGGSTDGTQEIIKKFVARYEFIKFFENEKKIIPAALNIGIRKSCGKYIVRLDAHATYDIGYVNKCIEVLANSDKEVANVGGVIETKPSGTSLFAKAIAYVLSSKLGVGNSTFRVSVPNASQFEKTVPFGCYRREVFEEIGFFNENEHRNEDIEFNKRLISSGKKILLDPEIKSSYFSRKDLNSFSKQQFNNGFIVTNKYRGKESFHKLRHFVPLFFVLYLFCSLITLVLNISESTLLFSYLIISSWLLYIFISLCLGIYYAVTKRQWFTFLSIPIALFTLHFSYGIGSIWGVVNIMKKKNNSQPKVDSRKNNFSEFLSEVFPYKSPFERTHLGTFHNLVKYFALRVAFLFYKLRITANYLDIIALVLTVPAFFLIYKGIDNLSFSLIFSGYILIAWILFIDFIDGSLARMHKYVFRVGDDLDNLPPSIVRACSYLVIGFLTQEEILFIMTFVNTIILSLYVPNTSESILESKKYIKLFIGSKMSLTGLRLLSGLILPLTCILYIYNQEIGSVVASCLVVSYSLMCFLWILHSFEDKTLKPKK